MLPPDQRLLETDLKLAEYRDGAKKGLWGQADAAALPAGGAVWPNGYFWMAATPRRAAPDRFYVALNLAGYRAVPPTGAFWDPEKKQTLELGKWPKGKAGSRFALVFRTDGFTFAGRAFYHPYDRSPLSDHPEWGKTEHLQWVWGPSHTIVDYLEEFQSLLTCGDYVGV